MLWRKQAIADISESARLPIFLPRGRTSGGYLLKTNHTGQLHCDVLQTLRKFRHGFWILYSKSHVRQVLRHCLICRKLEGGPYRMSDMPLFLKSRVLQSTDLPLTDLSYLGLLFTKSNDENNKR